MKILISILLCLVIFPHLYGTPQKGVDDTLVVAFWNLENLFDTIDDENKNDGEFLPDGSKEWTEERLDKKYYNLSRVIRLMGDSKGPDILGVCELEHQYLLDSLTSKFLNDFNYKSLALEAPDDRGIDNGLIYNADKFSLLAVRGDTVLLGDGYPTRLIFGCTLLTKTKDTLFVFVNHWPSRRGGEEKSEVNRISAAQVLKKNVDDLLSVNESRNIIILGDFNDEPSNKSILEILQAHPAECSESTVNDKKDLSALYNLSYQSFEAGDGSYKYQDNWNMLDQIIISGNICVGDRVQYVSGSFEVFKPLIMVTRTGNFAGTPFPTFGGSRYLGGYSDHFPVRAKIVLKGGN